MTTGPLNCRWLRRGLAAAGFAVCLFQGLPAAPADATRAASPAATPYRPPEDPQELLKVDESMRQYFAQRISARAADYDRLRALVEAIVDPAGLDFIYDAEGTFDARETFRRRRGNCASYAFLIVAVAREFGMRANFQNIDRLARWARVGDVVISVRHLDVNVMLEDGAYVIDPEPNLVPPGQSNAMRVISDAAAAAQFYCNIGVEQLVLGRVDESLHYMTLATTVDPTCAAAWSNRATLHARMGDLATARAQFERSLRLEPGGEAAVDGFVTVLRRLGTPEDLRRADRLERRVRAIRERNPYYQQYRAAQARERGDLPTAEKLLKRAIALKSNEPDFYVQRIAVLEQLGRADDARRAARKLEQVRARLSAMSMRIAP